MHTSSYVDAADSYMEKISKSAKGWQYEYNGQQKPVKEEKITLSIRAAPSKHKRNSKRCIRIMVPSWPNEMINGSV
jgi:acyl-homoserine lactone acylase PvdQ